MTTLAQAKEAFFEQARRGGAICPCCGQFGRVYKRKVHSGMAAVLILLYRFQNLGFTHVHTLINSTTNPAVAAAIRGDSAKLRYWGLIEEGPKIVSSTKKHKGTWRITGAGASFVEGSSSVQRYVWLYKWQAPWFCRRAGDYLRRARGPFQLRRAYGARVMREFLLRLVQWLDEPRVIYDREGGSPYLSRWYLLREKPADDELLKGQRGDDKQPPTLDLYLHRFHRSDDDRALHNHPWKWALAFILSGGYTEERRVGNAVVRRTIKPFSLNLIRSTDYHRVDLLREDSWSLFLVGPKIDTWYFWDRDLKARMPWRLFIRVKREGIEPEWEPG